jgi:hypothetical protein
MRFDVITLFPELFAPFLASGVTRRAYESGRSTCACGTCATTPRATTGAWTTGRSAAAPAW